MVPSCKSTFASNGSCANVPDRIWEYNQEFYVFEMMHDQK